MSTLDQDIRDYYFTHFDELPADKQFHFVSRLASWDNDKQATQLLEQLRKWLFRCRWLTGREADKLFWQRIGFYDRACNSSNGKTCEKRVQNSWDSSVAHLRIKALSAASAVQVMWAYRVQRSPTLSMRKLGSERSWEKWKPTESHIMCWVCSS